MPVKRPLDSGLMQKLLREWLRNEAVRLEHEDGALLIPACGSDFPDFGTILRERTSCRLKYERFVRNDSCNGKSLINAFPKRKEGIRLITFIERRAKESRHPSEFRL